MDTYTTENGIMEHNLGLFSKFDGARSQPKWEFVTRVTAFTLSETLPSHS